MSKEFSPGRMSRRRFLQVGAQVVGILAATSPATDALAAFAGEDRIQKANQELPTYETVQEQSVLHIVQTGIRNIFIDGSTYEVEVKSEIVDRLVRRLADQRNSEELMGKVAQYLDTHELEINIRKTYSLDDPIGVFVFPHQNPNGNRPAIQISEDVLKIIFNFQTRQISSADTVLITVLPHEIDHFINFIDDPAYDLGAYKKDLRIKLSHLLLLSTAASGLLGALIGRANKRNMGLLGGALGVLTGAEISAGAAPFLRDLVIGTHFDTPEVYKSLPVRMQEDPELVRLTSDTFLFNKINK